jgi:carbonic anhydrase
MTLKSDKVESFLEVVREQESPIRIYPDQTAFISKKIEFGWKEVIKGHFEGDEGHQNFIVDDCGSEESSLVHFGSQKWKLVKIHFHRRSEHLLESKQAKDGSFDAEIHFIHTPVEESIDTGDKMIEPSENLVLGTFVVESSTGAKSDELMAFFSACKSGEKTVQLPLEIIRQVTKLEHFFFYRGSLTTKPYSENISWVLFNSPLQLDKTVLDPICPTTQEARNGQPWNRRFVLRNFQ